MLLAKFHNHRTISFVGKYFGGFYHIYFLSPFPRRLHIKFGLDWPSGFKNQRTNGPVNAHLISWPGKEQNIQNLENIW